MTAGTQQRPAARPAAPPLPDKPEPPPQSGPENLLRAVPFVTGFAVLALALAVLVVGWGFGVAAARTLTTASAQVRPLTAACLLLLAGALLLRAWQPGHARRPARIATYLGPVAAGLVAIAMLAEYLTGADLHLDLALFPNELLEAGGPYPGRVPSESAVGLVLAAVGLLLVGVHRRWALIVSQVTALASGTLGLTLLYGVIYYSFETLTGPPPGLAALSALCFVGLAVGLLALPPDGALARMISGGSVGAQVGRRLLLAALVVPFVLGWVPIVFEHALGNSRYGVGLLVTGNAVSFGVVSFVAVRMALRWEAASASAASAAQETYDQLLAMIDNTSAVIYIRDLEGRYLLINREYERLFEVRRDEVRGLTDHDLFPAEVADAFRANDIAAVERGRPVSMEEVAPGEDGPHTYITVKFPLFGTDGRAYAVCGISTDITARQRAEAEVRRLNEDLEDRILERTAELEASTRELDAFAYSVSHDLRAPLRSLDGFSQVLQEDYAEVLDETGRDYLRRIATNASRMGQMIDDLLNLSRTTRLELRRVPVDLSALAADVVAELQEGAPERAVEVAIEPGLTATGDQHLLRLALMNLISNAWKFTGKVEAGRIEVGRLDAAGERAFYVKDNGAGFDMAYADKLFDPFNRLHSRSDFDGSGLGLAIVHRIVRRHGGKVWATAAVGAGATFHFTLNSPRAERGAEDRPAESTKDWPASVERARAYPAGEG